MAAYVEERHHVASALTRGSAARQRPNNPISIAMNINASVAAVLSDDEKAFPPLATILNHLALAFVRPVALKRSFLLLPWLYLDRIPRRSVQLER
jgi:hypothetical protein